MNEVHNGYLSDGSPVTYDSLHNAGLLGPMAYKNAGDPPPNAEEARVMAALNGGLAELRRKFEEVEKGTTSLEEFKSFSKKMDDHFNAFEAKLVALQRAARTTEKDPEQKMIDMAIELAGITERKTVYREELTNDMMAKAANYRRDFIAYLRKGDAAITPLMNEVKALSGASSADGGFWVPTTVSSRLIEKMFETSPLMELATVETVSGDSLELPIDRQNVAAQWVDDTTAHTAGNTEQIGKKVILAHNLQRAIRASSNLLEDANRDVEAWAAGKAALSFSLGANAAFVNGNGVGKPFGFLGYSTILYAKSNDTDPTSPAWGKSSYVKLGNSSGAIPNLDGLLNLITSLKGVYLPNAAYLMERTAAGSLRVLKDAQNRYLLDYSNAKRGQADLFGYPLRPADDMPVAAANAYVAAFGDWRQAYTVVMRRGTRLLRDPFSAKPWVELDFTMRVGGDVVDHDAYRLGRIEA